MPVITILRAPVLCVAFLGLLGAFPPAVAQTGGGACAFEAPVAPNLHRVVSYQLGADGFQFTSRADETLRGSFDLAAARLILQEESGNMTPVRLTIEYASVVEFRDVDGDARLGFSDEVVRELALPGATGATLQAIPQIRSGAYGALARYPLNGTGLLSGVAEIRFVVLSDPASIQGEERSPERVFVSTAVESFPFARNDTRLAIKVRQQGGANLSTAAQEIVSEGSPRSLSFRWSRCVDREGSTLPMGPLVIEYPSGTVPRTTTVFAFPYGNRVEHLSSAGLATPAVDVDGFDVGRLLPRGDLFAFGLAAIAAGAAVSMTAWRRLRGA